MKPIPAQKTVRVKCSYCNKGMDCPINIFGIVDKNMCYGCFNKYDFDKNPSSEKEKIFFEYQPALDKAHELIERIIEQVGDNMFRERWKENRKYFQMLTKEELARLMFKDGFLDGIEYAKNTAEKETEDDDEINPEIDY